MKISWKTRWWVSENLPCRRVGWGMAVVGIFFGMMVTGGCDRMEAGAAAEMAGGFGGTGRGGGQFVYPRAIAIDQNDAIFVVDKTARVQHLSLAGETLGGWTMPAFQAGKPVGLTCGQDGKVYVADTHYHRVMVFTREGELVREFGEYGLQPGQFIYPTDVEIAPDGRIFVSEYGGNDRISVFSPEGKILKTIGSFGEDVKEFSRPSAMCLDPRRGILYVADSCNHRIVKYDLDGRVLGVIGRCGTAAGQLKYPYDVNLMADGSLVVCEYGNNRIQRFSPDGESLGMWGSAGRREGELLYPWGVVVDSRGRVIIVDSGNNRIQIWRILK